MNRRKKITGFLLVLPILTGTFVFFVLPFLLCLKYSFTFGVGGAVFNGFENYREVMSSHAFQLAVKNTLRFLGIGVSLNLLLSFFIALGIKAELGGTRFLRYILLLPMMLPIASVVMVVQVFFSDMGIVNHWLLSLGFPLVKWLQGPKAFWILVGLYLWKNFGYNVILLLSGLNMIPEELYQTAAMEGAGRLQKLFFITIPLLAPHLFLTLLMSIINSFKSYREAFLLGGKHPHDSIYMLQHFLNNNFENLNYQRLSVAAILLFLILFVLLAFFYMLQNRQKQ